MEYLALIYADEAAWERFSDEEREAAYEQYGEFAQAAREAGVLVGGDELGPTASATTVRVRDGQSARDGRPVRRGEGSARRLLHPRLPVARRGGHVGGADPGRVARRRRGPAGVRRRGGNGMKYALLVYSDQADWEGIDEEEAARRRAESMPRWIALFEEMGKADPDAAGQGARRGHRGEGRARSSTARRSSPTGRSPRRRSRSAGSSSRRFPTSTRRSGSPRSCPRPSTARWRFGLSWNGDRRSRPRFERSGLVPSRSSPASSVISRSPRTRCRTPSRPRSSAGRATGCRARPAPGSSRPRGTARSTGSAASARSRARRSCSRASRPSPPTRRRT